MFRPNCTAIFRLVFEQVECTCSEQREDGATIGPKHVAGIIIQYNLIKYKVVYDYYIFFILYFSVYSTHRDASLGKKKKLI